MLSDKERRAFEYRRMREHQNSTYRNSGLWVNGVDQRQFCGGGAVYGCHALAAFHSARFLTSQRASRRAR